MRKFTKTEKSWIMYDFANSVYATIMLAAIMPAYFAKLVPGNRGDYWWAIGTTAATIIMVFLSPIVGAIGDFKGMKKKLFGGFLALGLIFTFANALTDIWQLLLIGYGLSHIGFLGSCLCYDAFLTDITDSDNMDRVSAWGYGLGYIGGSTIPFVLSIALIMFGDRIGLHGSMPVRLSLIITVVWWGLFSIPFLRNVRQTHYLEKAENGIVRAAFVNLWHTFKEIVANRTLMIYIFAYFFYIDGVNTVITMATAYGSTLGLDTTGMILALMITQLVAFPCAILFNRIAQKIGTLNIILAAVGVYAVICVLGFVMGFGLEEKFLTMGQAQAIFWLLAVMVGTCQGGIQAMSRSYFGKQTPPEKSNEYFGFYDIFGKFAAVLGPGLYALIKGVSGRSSYAILGIILLFFAGGILLVFARNAAARGADPVGIK